MTCFYKRKHIPSLPGDSARALDDEFYAIEQVVACIQENQKNGIGEVKEDLSPELGGDLNTGGYHVVISDDNLITQGALVDMPTGGVALIATDTSGNWDDTMAGVGAFAGDVRLSGTTTTIDNLKSGGLREVWVTPEGTLYTVVPPTPGWQVTDSDSGDYPIGSAWSPLSGLAVGTFAVIDAGSRLDVSARVRVSNPGADSGIIKFSFGIGGAVPTGSGEAVTISADFEGLVPISGWGAVGQTYPANTQLMMWVVADPDNKPHFAASVKGSVDSPHVITVSTPSESGAAGATNLSVINVTSTNITVASDTGTDAVLPAATTTTAGVATSSQITLLNAAVPNTRTISTANGLQGGGSLAANRTISPVYGSTSNTVCQGNDSRLANLSHYQGKWLGGSYILNDIVVAGRYLAIANKNTTQSPKPVSGGRKNIMITEPAWLDYTTASSKYGIQIGGMLAKYPVVGVRIKIPTAGHITFSIGINNVLTTIYSGYYLEANRWTDLYFEPVILNIDDKVDFMVEALTRKYSNSYFAAGNNILGFVAANYPVLAGELVTTAFAVNPIYDNITSWPTDWDLLSVY